MKYVIVALSSLFLSLPAFANDVPEMVRISAYPVALAFNVYPNNDFTKKASKVIEIAWGYDHLGGIIGKKDPLSMMTITCLDTKVLLQSGINKSLRYDATSYMSPSLCAQIHEHLSGRISETCYVFEARFKYRQLNEPIFSGLKVTFQDNRHECRR